MRKRHFLSTFYVKIIILPRQARDKHREKSKKCRSLAGAAAVRKTPLFLRTFLYKNDHFAKTGSGQTWGKLRKEMRFLLQGYAAPPCAALAWAALEGDGVPSAQRHSEELPQPRYAHGNAYLLRCHFILRLIVLPRQARDKHTMRLRIPNQICPRIGVKRGKLIGYLHTHSMLMHVRLCIVCACTRACTYSRTIAGQWYCSLPPLY